MMKSIKEIVKEEPSPWSGSETTQNLVRSQISQRWTKEEAENFDPKYDTRTFRGWREQNYFVNKNEKGLESFVLIEKKDAQGKIIKKYNKKIWLFHRKQVSPISN